MNTLKIVAAQINLLVGDIHGNAQRIIEAAQRAIHDYAADVVVFPELALTGYPPEDLLFRPGLYRHCNDALQFIQQQNLPATLIIGLPTMRDDQRYNSAAVVQDGKLITTYDKQKLPNYEVFDEERYFKRGDKPCVIQVKETNIAITICEDLWHPQPLQQAVQAGAQLAVCLNASPFDRNKSHARENILIERATSNNIPIIYANLVGGQDELVFDGGSMVVDATGKRIQQAKYFAEDLLCIECECAQQIKIQPHPLPKALSEQEKVYQALTLGVRDYIQKNNFPGAIIGLSGGIDSALTLTIAADAIGPENVRVVLMPSRFTSQMSIDDAIEQANILGVRYDIISIEPIFEEYLKSLQPVLAGTKPDTTEENIQARIRGNLLMALSNKYGSIVLTTGNKSEFSVGYSTLYGDLAGGFSVLKDVLKTLVYELANYRNTLASAIPKRVIERAPSAELAEDQVDQDSLPPYPVLDEIIRCYVEQDMDPHAIYSNDMDKATVDRVVRMINFNEYKRRQAPIGIRTTERAFGKDRRYPITSGYHKNHK